MWTIFKVFTESVTVLLLFVTFSFFGCELCGILAPWSEIKPESPTLEGEILTTGLLGKSLYLDFLILPNLPTSGREAYYLEYCLSEDLVPWSSSYLFFLSVAQICGLVFLSHVYFCAPFKISSHILGTKSSVLCPSIWFLVKDDRVRRGPSWFSSFLSISCFRLLGGASSFRRPWVWPGTLLLVLAPSLRICSFAKFTNLCFKCHLCMNEFWIYISSPTRLFMVTVSEVVIWHLKM